MTEQDIKAYNQAIQILEANALCEILAYKIDAIEANGHKFTQHLKVSLKNARNECLKQAEWLWDMVADGGYEAELEVFSLQEPYNAIPKLLINYPPERLDELKNFIQTQIDLKK